MTDESFVGEFELWEYTVGHKQLLLRRPPSAGKIGNIDLVFGGVKYVSIPSRISNPRITTWDGLERLDFLDEPKMVIDKGQLFIIEGDGRRSFIVASSFRYEENELDIFESGLEVWADSRSVAERFEKAVLLALDEYRPKLDSKPRQGVSKHTRFDALISVRESPDRVIGVEVKWLSVKAAKVATRRWITEMVERRIQSGESLAGVLFVVGTHNPSAISQLTNHAVTALDGFVVEIVGWLEGDSEDVLRSAVDKILEQV